jgi:hypothetical protein
MVGKWSEGGEERVYGGSERDATQYKYVSI